MDLAALRIFKAVAEHGGVNKAAEKLHRVPSNVTTRVKQLEESLGTKLFVRQNRSLALSQEGRLLLTYADRLLRLSAEAENALRNGKPRGTLRIGALESTSATRLPPVLSRYHQLYPDVQIELVTGTSGALVSLVHRQDIEAAFVAQPFNDQGLAMQSVFVEELVLIAAKSFGRIRSPKDIGKRTVIAFATGCSYRRRLESWLATANVLPDRVMEFQSYHAIVACVAAGSGIAVVPRSVIAMMSGAGEVIVNPLPATIAKAPTQLIWRPEHQSVALEALQKLFESEQVRKAKRK
ncbi:MAG TPA: LysR substrate-binding domain-containing protein [Burkholderiales bacterium]|nr:LysR substrate-binding domain-containing protein [Burkholderiales bacterium]